MHQVRPASHAVVRFGHFDLDLRTGELSKAGVRTRLQEHPFKILERLVERPGQLVTRDQLRERLWPQGTIVDFEHGVNTAMKLLRQSLGDDADHPRYIETLPRRGYRFVASVQVVTSGAAESDPNPCEDAQRDGVRPSQSMAVSQYRVTEQIGAGSMGEVFRAEDLALKRQVALKFLPRAFAADPKRVARFQREAEVLASLSHPNVEEIYGLGEADGRRCLVLELVEGESLADRIRRGPMPIDEALRVCRQIADALQAAHERRIVHRDLSPTNVKITATGRVKLLDFGLAKFMAGQAPCDGPGAGAAGTISDVGFVAGTAGYISPEQLDGKPVDRRADIWAFGCVLFECLAGTPPFPGRTAPAIMAAVLRSEPDWQALPVATPPGLRTLLERCLRKDPRRRLHDIADARLEIDEALGMPEDAAAIDDWPRVVRRRRPSLFRTATRAAAALRRALAHRKVAHGRRH